jgi:hypothetical protein
MKCTEHFYSVDSTECHRVSEGYSNYAGRHSCGKAGEVPVHEVGGSFSKHGMTVAVGNDARGQLLRPS